MAARGPHARARRVDHALGAHARRSRRMARVRAARDRRAPRGLATGRTARRLRRVDARDGARGAAARREPRGREGPAHAGRLLCCALRTTGAAGSPALPDRPLRRGLGRRAPLHPAGRSLSAGRRRRVRPLAAASPEMCAGARLLLDLHDPRRRPHAGTRGHAAPRGARGPGARLDGASLAPGSARARAHLWARRRSTSHLHSTPLQIVVERGVPGLAAWIAIWVAFFAASAGTLSRIPAGDEDARALVLGSMAAIAAFLVAGLFEYNFGDTEVLLVALALMALPFIVQRDLDAAAASVRRVDGA